MSGTKNKIRDNRDYVKSNANHLADLVQSTAAMHSVFKNDFQFHFIVFKDKYFVPATAVEFNILLAHSLTSVMFHPSMLGVCVDELLKDGFSVQFSRTETLPNYLDIHAVRLLK